MATPMMETPKVEGEQEQPTSEPSQPTGQLSREDVQALIARLDEQDKLIKGLQKGTDKQIGQVRDNVKRILELKEKGLDESQINRELFLDTLMDSQNTPAAPVVGKQPEQPSLDVNAVVKAMLLDESDVAVAAIKKAYVNNPVELVAQLANLKESRSSVKPVTPASSLPPEGGNTPADKDVQALAQEYSHKVMEARGNKALIRQLKEEYRQKGVPVDQVYFGV